MARHNHSFAWTEQSRGTWQRDIDEPEMFWATAARTYDTGERRRFAITGHVSVSLDTPEIVSHQKVNDALRNAWVRARHEHPSIASRVDYNPTTRSFARIYRQVQNAADLEAWIQNTFVEISNFTSGVEFANSDPPAPDRPTIFVVTPTQENGGLTRRDIVLRAPHDTIDGMGALMFLGQLLRYASQAIDDSGSCVFQSPSGREIQNLSPPYRVAANLPTELTPTQKTRVDDLYSNHAFFRQKQDERCYASLPFRPGPQTPGRHRRTAMKLTTQETSKLLEGCKSHGITITHAIHAAIPFVLMDLQDRDLDKALFFRCDMLRNLRPFCIDPYAGSQHPVTAYHVGSSFGLELEIPRQDQGVSVSQRFASVLQEIKAFYRRVAEDADHWYLASYIWQGWLEGLPELKAKPERGPPPSPNATVHLSSLGKLDDVLPPTLGHFKISDPWITGEELGNGYGLFLTSHSGQISLVAAYNEAWHVEDDVQNFLQACKQAVCIGLGIGS